MIIKNMDNNHDKIVEQDAYKCDGDLINLDNKQTEQTHDELRENHSIVNTNIDKEHISKSNKLNPNKILDNAVKDNMKNIKEPIKQTIKKSIKLDTNNMISEDDSIDSNKNITANIADTRTKINDVSWLIINSAANTVLPRKPDIALPV
jgi:hypothetical protein